MKPSKPELFCHGGSNVVDLVGILVGTDGESRAEKTASPAQSLPGSVFELKPKTAPTTLAPLRLCPKRSKKTKPLRWRIGLHHKTPMLRREASHRVETQEVLLFRVNVPSIKIPRNGETLFLQRPPRNRSVRSTAKMQKKFLFLPQTPPTLFSQRQIPCPLPKRHPAIPFCPKRLLMSSGRGFRTNRHPLQTEPSFEQERSYRMRPAPTCATVFFISALFGKRVSPPKKRFSNTFSWSGGFPQCSISW
jgi:hypothetical protein